MKNIKKIVKKINFYLFISFYKKFLKIVFKFMPLKHLLIFLIKYKNSNKERPTEF